METFLRYWGRFQTGHTLVWTNPDKLSYWFEAGTSEQNMAERVIEIADRKVVDVYIGCAQRRDHYGPGMRGKREHCIGLPGLYLDLDFNPSHHKKNVPPTQEDAQWIVQQMGATPNMIVHSGHGLHAWWMFREPIMFEDEDSQRAVEQLMKGWEETARAHATSRGWELDSVSDLPRVLRIPGTLNRKHEPHVEVVLIHDLGNGYEVDNLKELIKPELLHKAEAEAAQVDVGPITLGAIKEEPPQLQALLANDEKFASIYYHKIPVGHDSSCSSYDLSLATRLLATGDFGTQTVIDILVCHRKYHQGDDAPKLKRESYYRATISKAMSGVPQERYQDQVAHMKETGKLRDDVDTHDAIKKVIRGTIGLPIDYLICYQGSPSTFVMVLDGGIEQLIGEADNLTSQAKFKSKCADPPLLRFPSPIQAGEAWASFVQNMLQLTRVKDAPEGGTYDGSVQQALQEYKAQALSISAEDVMTFVRLGKPYIREGFVYFTLEACRNWMQKHKSLNMTQHKLAVYLKRFGWEEGRQRAKDGSDKTDRVHQFRTWCQGVSQSY